MLPSLKEWQMIVHFIIMISLTLTTISLMTIVVFWLNGWTPVWIQFFLLIASAKLFGLSLIVSFTLFLLKDFSNTDDVDFF